jgi:lipoprotein-anchoring transpeptidase ErfK/SrfK
MTTFVVIAICIVLTLVELGVVAAVFSPQRAKALAIRLRYPAAAVVAIGVAAGVIATSIKTSSAEPADHRGALAQRSADRHTNRRVARPRRRLVTIQQPGALVAIAHRGDIPIYTSAGGEVAQEMSNPTSNGGELVFLVKHTNGDWLDVYLPVRPNGSTGWVKRSDVSVARDPYSVVVNLSSHTVTVRNGSKLFMREPVGVGRALSPTPDGTYYVTETIVTGDPEGPYGPYALGLSAHSTVYNEFDGGDGQIGLHGTDNPLGIGTDVSHGCIRMQNDDITRLAHVLPLGTPVLIRRA